MQTTLRKTAEAMGPLVWKHRADTEADRRLAPAIVDALIDSGLCRMGLPPGLAGPDAHPVDWLAALETLAGFEASVPWIAWNNALVGLLARFLGDDARAELFRDPRWLYAQSTRPSGTAVPEGDAFRISGRWSLVSGCELAEWLLLLCTTPGEEGGRFCFVPRDSAEILDTWHVGGLRGTGSHDVVVRDCVVPRAQSLSLGDASTAPGALGRVPIFCLVGAGFAAQTLGVAGATFDTVFETTSERAARGPAPELRPILTELARSRVELQAARAQLHAATARIWELAVAGEDASRVAIASLHSAGLHAMEQSRRTVYAMYAAGGTRALYTDSPLERAHRDIHAMLRHIVAQPVWLEDAGRVLVGLEPESSLFLR